MTYRAENGDAVGVSPDMAAEIARRLVVLGIAMTYVCYPDADALTDAAERG